MSRAAYLRRSWLGVILALWWSPILKAEVSLRFEVALGAEAAAEAKISDHGVTGRLYVFLSRRPDGEPRMGPNWFQPEPFLRVDVSNVRPGETRVVDGSAESFPRPLAQLPAGHYRVQALLDHDFYAQHHARGAGNFYSDVVQAAIDPGAHEAVRLVMDRVVHLRRFPESQWLKEVQLRSELLSNFHGREVLEYAGVVLPASYAVEPQRRFPVIYIIPGFGGSHFEALRHAAAAPTAAEGEVDFIRVMLSGNCKWGHHVYADSATNGPRGRALVEEMIPYIDANFRTIAEPTARFVSGHSSGGWSSLWLQVSYPDTFGGVWSTSPDPVDFRDYQQVDLYAVPPQSLYIDEQGNRRPIARRGQQPVLWYDSFGRMDDVLGRGGQLRSFEAVFSPLDDDGLPRRLWDRRTGRIDPEVAQAWQQYDVRLKLERNWPTLREKLQGKLRITVGDLDTFYLEGAVEKLAATLRELGSDAEIVILPGKDHGSVLTTELFSNMRRQMSRQFLKHHANKQPPAGTAAQGF